MASKKNWDDDNYWAVETFPLSEILPSIPTLVRVKEGIYSQNESGTFSQGDLLKIDSYGPMQRISAHLAKAGSENRYHQDGEEISLPYNYNGRVQVLPLHGELHKYTLVEDLIIYFPRHVRLLSQLTFKQPDGTVITLQVGDNLDLLSINRSKHGVLNLNCACKGKAYVIPRNVKGNFLVLPDTKEQTIKEVVDTYKLPQCVRFLEEGVQELMATDVKEAIGNMRSYHGEMLLTGIQKTTSVLFGHYKGITLDPNSRFCRRSAIVIPLDIPEICQIEVQLPNYMDADDYELFSLDNFSTCSNSNVDGSLYVSFTKTSVSRIQFVPDERKPPVPPKPGSKVSPAASQLTSSERRSAPSLQRAAAGVEVKPKYKTLRTPPMPPDQSNTPPKHATLAVKPVRISPEQVTPAPRPARITAKPPPPPQLVARIASEQTPKKRSAQAETAPRPVRTAPRPAGTAPKPASIPLEQMAIKPEENVTTAPRAIRMTSRPPDPPGSPEPAEQIRIAPNPVKVSPQVRVTTAQTKKATEQPRIRPSQNIKVSKSTRSSPDANVFDMSLISDIFAGGATSTDDDIYEYTGDDSADQEDIYEDPDEDYIQPLDSMPMPEKRHDIKMWRRLLKDIRDRVIHIHRGAGDKPTRKAPPLPEFEDPGTSDTPPLPEFEDPGTSDTAEQFYDYIDTSDIKIDGKTPHSKNALNKALSFVSHKNPPFSHKNPPSIPTQKVKPLSQKGSFTTPKRSSVGPDTFENMSVDDLEAVLKECHMKDLAELCVRENLDGEFLFTQNDAELRKEPFKLGDFHIGKLRRIQDGWRPKT